MTKLPTSAPQMVPRPPSVDGREHQQQHLEAELVVEALGQPEQHAGQAGQRGAADPDDADHALDVDAGGRRERRVVGHRAGGLADAGPLQRQARPRPGPTSASAAITDGLRGDEDRADRATAVGLEYWE